MPMIPISLDPGSANIAVAGNGKFALRRLLALRQAGAAAAWLYSPAQDAALKAAAGEYYAPELPGEAELGALHALWITGLEREQAADLAAAARRMRVLVNVEDVPELCDFHSVAEVRRGDLLLTVSTNGAAPGLARTIRRHLEGVFAAEWAEHVDEIARLRAVWRAQGVPLGEAARRIEAIARERCWLSTARPN